MALSYLWNSSSILFPLKPIFASFSSTPKPSIPIRLVVDWDGTLTEKDTLHIVAAIGYDYNRDTALTPWNDIVEAYLLDYRQYEQSYQPPAANRSTVAEESAWLASLKDVEERSVQRVDAAGIFSGVTYHDISEASQSAVKDKKLQLRKGWKDLLALAHPTKTDMQKDARVTILSVNWSGTFIRESLLFATSTSHPLNNTVASIPIFANEIHNHVANIRTSADKLAVFSKIRHDASKTLYFGDSATDFDCLLAADVGICVRDEPMDSGQRELKETLERVGIVVSRLGPEAWKTDETGETDVREATSVKREKTVWWVNDLAEAVKFIEERDSV